MVFMYMKIYICLYNSMKIYKIWSFLLLSRIWTEGLNQFMHDMLYWYLIIFLADALVDEVMFCGLYLSLWVIIHITNHPFAL